MIRGELTGTVQEYFEALTALYDKKDIIIEDIKAYKGDKRVHLEGNGNNSPTTLESVIYLIEGISKFLSKADYYHVHFRVDSPEQKFEARIYKDKEETYIEYIK